MSDDERFYPTLGTGSAHGGTDKEPPKPIGFAPPKPKIIIPTARRVKK